MKIKRIITISTLTLLPVLLHAEQTCQIAIVKTTPTHDFIPHSDGTVTHNKTGLMWQICSQGQLWSSGSCSGVAAFYTWQQALQITSTINVAGGYANYTDWRLPDIKELSSIVELQCNNPYINTDVFPSTKSTDYWSATPYIGYDDSAWVVRFGNGFDSYDFRNDFNQVRLVRYSN